MPYIYRVRRADVRPAAEQQSAAAQTDADEPSYRDLQARAKELDIPANQSREELESAIAEAER